MWFQKLPTYPTRSSACHFGGLAPRSGGPTRTEKRLGHFQAQWGTKRPKTGGMKLTESQPGLPLLVVRVTVLAPPLTTQDYQPLANPQNPGSPSTSEEGAPCFGPLWGGPLWSTTEPHLCPERCAPSHQQDVPTAHTCTAQDFPGEGGKGGGEGMGGVAVRRHPYIFLHSDLASAYPPTLTVTTHEATIPT